MLAWKKRKGQYGLVKTDCPIPKIKDTEVLVKVLATGICGTDFGIYKGYREVADGLTPGHEFIGEIVELGKDVAGYQVGDRVVPSIIQKCGTCPACIDGFEAQCENLREIGIHIDGSFAEYTAVPAVTLHKVGKDMDLKTGASIEPVAVAYSAVKKAEQFIPGKDVLIYGPGAIGLYTAQIAKIAGAGTILLAGTGADIERLALAKENYGVETINIEAEDIEAKMRDCFKHGKADLIFEATGVAQIIGDMLSKLRPHGELILVGVYHDSSEVNFLYAGRGELTIKGTFCYTLSEFESAIKLVEMGKINFDGIVDTIELENLDEGFEKTMSKQSIKIVAYHQ
ncbi:MAG: alcohol dehydrogenase catalytic domain-containing protein [Firmicutes bacterium]|jgi:2-desacetyl-2-hydroxyethyl bacteriochlorophyllide A dehydrogenase|nr:alcohol dehydrogenase catalytic domain-containing protein [Bacillota bacterium]